MNRRKFLAKLGIGVGVAAVTPMIPIPEPAPEFASFAPMGAPSQEWRDDQICIEHAQKFINSTFSTEWIPTEFSPSFHELARIEFGPMTAEREDEIERIYFDEGEDNG